MALPASGNPISFNQINVELGVTGTTTRSLNDAVVRTLFGVPSGAISMSNGFGKSNFGIGSAYQGGYYVGSYNGYNLIIAPSAGSQYNQWQSTQLSVGGTSLTDGVSNTNVNRGNSPICSACYNYTGGGYSGWYCPAIREYQLGNTGSTSPTQWTTFNNVTGSSAAWNQIGTDIFWSSTEASASAPYYYGYSNNSANTALKSNYMYARPYRRI